MLQEKYMRQAIELAKKGTGWVSPNPLVGAVIVKEGSIIGSGYHERYGELHAERNALAHCIESPAGATMYVTLEPCCHTGKQPPCTEAIIEHGIRKVVIGSRDPNPLVAGKGVQILREHGIEVVEDFLREECDVLNPIFFHYIQTKQPYVAMKTAMTLDGKIATYTGASKWVTGEEARLQVQKLRHQYRGIMVGVGTVLADNPSLTCRIDGGRNPMRIICDTHLQTPLDANVTDTSQAPTILATCNTNEADWQPYLLKKCQILIVEEQRGHLDLQDLVEKLGKMKIDSVLLEGGGTLNDAALQAEIVQKYYAYIAPKIFGGKDAKTPVEGCGVAMPDEAVRLCNVKMEQIGTDYRLEGDVAYVHRDC